MENVENVVIQAPRYVFQAYHLAEALKLKAIAPNMEMPALIQTGTRLVLKEGEASFVFLFRFGSVVFFNVEPRRQTDIMEKLGTMVGVSDVVTISDEYALEVQEGANNEIYFERVVMDRLTVDRISLIALIMAQSGALEYFEGKIDELLNRSREIGGFLEAAGRMKLTGRSINKFIGSCMRAKQDLVSSLYLLDKPDETWEDQVLDTLYRDAVDMFELKERYKTVDYKLKTVEENLKLIAGLLANRKAAFLEWLIIILIGIEVVLFVYELWIK